jgi:Domain of unknown function (DUF4136)
MNPWPGSSLANASELPRYVGQTRGNEVSYEHSKTKTISQIVCINHVAGKPGFCGSHRGRLRPSRELRTLTHLFMGEGPNSQFYLGRKNAIHTQLAAEGWTQVPSAGEVTVVAIERTQVQQQIDTLYDGFGGRRFFGGFGEATTTVQNYKVGTLVIDMYDAASKNLIWRGSSSDALSGNPERNARNMHKEVKKMFQHFAPEARS